MRPYASPLVKRLMQLSEDGLLDKLQFSIWGVVVVLVCATSIVSGLGFGVLLLVLALAAVLLPIGGAMVAIRLVLLDTRSPMYDLLTVSLVSNWQLAAAYFWVTLYRVRSFIVATVAAIPFFVAAMGLVLGLGRFMSADGLTGTPSADEMRGLLSLLENPYYDLDLAIILFGLMLIGLWGMNWLGISLGIWMGLLWRNHYSVVGVTVAIGFILVVGFWLYASVIPLPYDSSDTMWAGWLTMCLLPYIAAVCCFGMAITAARR